MKWHNYLDIKNKKTYTQVKDCVFWHSPCLKEGGVSKTLWSETLIMITVGVDRLQLTGQIF